MSMGQPYSHCKTRIVDLKNLPLPPDTPAHEDIAEAFYATYRAQLSSPPLSDLFRAITTLKSGLAPPIAFPTETVYGLGADATRSSAVQSIFDAKNRPSDNPLIVHVSSLKQLQDLFKTPLPAIYQPLVSRFWPGPLTILLPLPTSNPFAPEVSCGLSTVGIRMPSTPLARLLISLVGKPLAAPSANASTRPSPTTAQHVMEDMNGRINFILDGGPCTVGVESTVVDGLCDPPEILRPGGVGLEQIRALGGQWAKTVIRPSEKANEADSPHVLINGNSTGGNMSEEAPRAPGMKYKHYSPRARVVLFKSGTDVERAGEYIEELLSSHPKLDSASAEVNPRQNGRRIGIISTQSWTLFAGLMVSPVPISSISQQGSHPPDHNSRNALPQPSLHDLNPQSQPQATPSPHLEIPTTFLAAGHLLFTPLPPPTSSKPSSPNANQPPATATLFDIHLPTVPVLARHLFASLRALDQLGCAVIVVEGISDRGGTKSKITENNLAAAVMNRLRKAAEVEI